MRILFVGDSWQGSTARSMREALAVMPDLQVDDVGEDRYFPAGTSVVVRGSNRLLRLWHRAELERDILADLAARAPDCLLVYRGGGVCADFVRRVRQMGIFTVNVFPDYSPHSFGALLRASLGAYDLVVSTKPFHPGGWASVYGYTNRCVCVPHGYDPKLHVWSDPPGVQDFDVVLAATWRHQYQVVMERLAVLCQDLGLRIGIVGNGWRERIGQSQPGWHVAPALSGRAYGEWLRRGRIVVAPVHRDAVARGVRQHGDEDTIRTYELAAMGCFFVHRRTPFAQTVYDERTEVPMWDDAEELANLVRHYLPLDRERADMARRAHGRAVPAYSIPNRAKQVVEQIRAARQASEATRS